MKLNASVGTAALIAGLTALAGCDRPPEQPRLGEAPSYTKDRAAPAMPSGGPTASRSTGAPPESQRSVGRQIDDAGINARVKAALLASNDVEGSAIDVDTEDGRVVLRGKVADKAQIDRAVQIARRVDGVNQVDSQLTTRGAS